jgi:YVTN family beta-propeller protein
MMKMLVMLVCSAMLYFSSAFAETPEKSNYTVINRIPLAGDGGWDCCKLDEAGNRLFVSHGSQVQVIDVTTRKQVGIVLDTKGVHDIAFVSELKKAYVSNGKDTSVTIVDLTTLATLNKIHVTGSDPDAIIYDPFSQCVFVFNGKSDNATAIDARTDKVTATIALGGAPEFAVPNDAGLLYVNIEDKDEVAVINTRTMLVEKKWPVASAPKPCAITIDKKNNRLFVGCRSKVMVVMDATSGKVLATLPIGDHVDGACFDVSKGLAFFSNGEGTITVIEAEAGNNYEVAQTVPTQKGAKTIALNAVTHHMYLPTADYGAAPAPTAENPKPKAPVKPGSFVVLEVAPKGK